MLYLIELIVAIILCAILLIIFRKKEPKKVLKMFALIFLLFIIAAGITFALEKPKIEIKEENLKVEANVDTSLKIAKTTYHFFDITKKVEIEGNIDYSKIGTYEITYKVPTLFGTYTEKETISVVDTTPPDLTLTGEIEINQSYASEFQEPGFTAVDACEGDLAQKVTVKKTDVNENEQEIKYTVSDSSGNTITKTRKIHIVDDVPPVITLNGSKSVTVIIGNNYNEKGAKAVDEKDGDLTDKIVTEGLVDASKEGTYEITYKVTR